jgi:methionyl-tRNA formyltransferase
MTLRLAFMGSPAFALPALEALIAAGHEIACVYSQPPRPAGRGQAEQHSAVHQCADGFGLPVRTPLSLKSTEEQQSFAALAADAAVVVAYGLLLPRAILESPRHGCFNVHASLLPRWRGAAPIQRAIMAGDAETGISIMRMEEGLDTAPRLRTQPITVNDVRCSRGLALRRSDGRGPGEAEANLALPPQKRSVTYARKIDKAEARIDFNRTAVEARNHIHGLSPFPGGWLTLPDRGRDVRVKILRCEVIEAAGAPGEVLDDHLTIACAEGALRLLELQREGKGAMGAEAFLRGLAVAPGTRLA